MTNLDDILVRAAAELDAEPASNPAPDTEFSTLITRIRSTSEALADAYQEQTLLMAYARTLMPPVSYQTLAAASGLSYSGVRKRLTPEVMNAVRKAGDHAQ